ncbi:unnamed protein product [Aphanomyces euteiches]|uniref:Uncharacterized protein n=1 Tax=Aphanomyces euteiches TaxID=100861 RepID=A0A6G0WY85_9STRA|nr:hypothetical protein Ae201684_010471 [Aphanomyces euteiches]KAH9089899.1 hypothetical protein Ae201684P_014654 [Aphanomyces euteiches]KAH9151905.1 hypothetical protein AeRB84_005594 [Aphanomyces euteiches]
MDEVLKKIVACRQASVQTTHGLFDEVDIAVREASVLMTAMFQKQLDQGSKEMQVAMLNKFVHFVCSKVDVRNVNGLVSLVQAFVSEDADAVEDFIQNGKNVVLYAKETSDAKPSPITSIVVPAHQCGASVLSVDPSPDVCAILTADESSVSEESSLKRKDSDLEQVAIPPYAKKICTSNTWESTVEVPSRRERRTSDRFPLSDPPGIFVPKTKREAIEWIAGRQRGSAKDNAWVASQVLDEFDMEVTSEYVRRVLSRRNSIIIS